jgi:hypothetical protein
MPEYQSGMCPFKKDYPQAQYPHDADQHRPTKLASLHSKQLVLE